MCEVRLFWTSQSLVLESHADDGLVPKCVCCLWKWTNKPLLLEIKREWFVTVNSRARLFLTPAHEPLLRSCLWGLWFGLSWRFYGSVKRPCCFSLFFHLNTLCEDVRSVVAEYAHESILGKTVFKCSELQFRRNVFRSFQKLKIILFKFLLGHLGMPR